MGADSRSSSTVTTSTSLTPRRGSSCCDLADVVVPGEPSAAPELRVGVEHVEHPPAGGQVASPLPQASLIGASR